MKALMLVLAALPVTAVAGEFDKVTNDQLCVAYAETVITGSSFRVNLFKRIPAERLVAEIEARNETCSPTEKYMQAAQYRLQARAEARAETIQALQNYSNRPYAAPPVNVPPPPRTTNCRLVGQNVTCTTWQR